MADKVIAGQPIPRSAALWNNLIGAANQYAASQMGEPRQNYSDSAPTNVIKIKNSSAAAIRLGEVLEITGFLLTNVRRTELWFDGDEPDGTHAFAIAMQDIPIGTIDRAQISGVCVALVNVTDAGHEYAVVASGEPVLQSSATASATRILYKPAGTGEKTCAVVFAGSDVKKHLVRFSLDEAMAKTDASADASIEYQVGPGAAHADVTITVNNPTDATNSAFTYAGAIGATGWAVWDSGTSFYIIDMDCEAA